MLLVAIGGYFINVIGGYWWLLMIIFLMLLVATSGYFISVIGGYWWLFY
jgi:hypothetical protein